MPAPRQRFGRRIKFQRPARRRGEGYGAAMDHPPYQGGLVSGGREISGIPMTTYIVDMLLIIC